MNTAIYDIVNYIIQKKPTLSLNDQSDEITIDLIKAGFKSDEINLAYHFIGFHGEQDIEEEEDSIESAINPFDFTLESASGLVEKLMNMVALFRETNVIADEKVETIFNQVGDNLKDIEEPRILAEILEAIFGEEGNFMDLEEIFLLFPLAFRYRKIY